MAEEAKQHEMSGAYRRTPSEVVEKRIITPVDWSRARV